MTASEFKIENSFEFSKLIHEHDIDHLDFGCSKGGSLKFAEKYFGGINGLGIDTNKEKVRICRNVGLNAILYDIHDIPDEKMVRFVLMSHFLEHIPNLLDVKCFIHKACTVSTDFVYIQQPFFDADGYLARQGLKLFWSDWTGHPNHMTALDLYLILRDLQKEGIPIKYSIHFHNRIYDSEDSHIHSICSPTDMHEFDPCKHPDKGKKKQFNELVFYEIKCMISMPGVDHSDLLKRFQYDYTLIDENRSLVKNNLRKKEPFLRYALRKWVS